MAISITTAVVGLAGLTQQGIAQDKQRRVQNQSKRRTEAMFSANQAQMAKDSMSERDELEKVQADLSAQDAAKQQAAASKNAKMKTQQGTGRLLGETL